MKYGLLLALSSVLTISSYAQSARINGTVYDVETLEPLSGVVLVLEGTHIGAQSDERGTFQMWAPDSGSYTISTSMIGYERASKMVQMTPGARIELNIYLATLEFMAPQLPLARRGEDGERIFRVSKNRIELKRE